MKLEESTPITSRETLHEYLAVALQLEHATIPPYTVALYSIKPGTNLDATNIIRVVAVEEMLHLTLAANILNATGGTPDLVRPDFVPNYPVPLPTGEKDFEVGIAKFSQESVKTFLNIERPADKPKPGDGSAFYHHAGLCFVRKDQRFKSGTSAAKGLLPTFKKRDEKTGQELELHYHSIGEFYQAIANGLEYLANALGESTLFCGDPSRQVTPEYYYSGGGAIVVVKDLKSAKEAIDLISEQGEGYDGHLYDDQGELAHYYRFQQLILGKYYVKGDSEGKPSGGDVDVDWSEVYPCKPNAKVADYVQSSELTLAAKTYNAQYKHFLSQINVAFNGEPERLIPAVGEMFHIRQGALDLIRNPILGEEGLHAVPTFEMDQVVDNYA